MAENGSSQPPRGAGSEWASRLVATTLVGALLLLRKVGAPADAASLAPGAPAPAPHVRTDPPHPPRRRAGALFTAVALLLLLTAGVLVRVTAFDQPPLDFHATRQLHSAEIARGMYYGVLPDVPAWQVEMALEGQAEKGLIEPQIMESVSAAAWVALGGEYLAVPRALSIAFWTLGALAIFGAGARVSGGVAGLVAAGVFLFLPFGVVASRAFMPDPLMVALMSAALWLGASWATAPPRTRMVWASGAGLVTGLAVLVKLTAGFMLAPFCVALVLGSAGVGLFRRPDVLVYAILTAAPPVAFILYAQAATGVGLEEHGSRLFPELWVTADFWSGWLAMIDGTVGLGVLGLALLGGLTLPHPAIRVGLVAWVLGYVAMVFTLSHHASTHDYYALPLFPVAAVGLGGLAHTAWRALRGRTGTKVTAALVALATLAASWVGSHARLTAHDHAADAQRYASLGALFLPEERIVGILPEYGHPFRYFGWRTYRHWPATFDRELMIEGANFTKIWRQRTAGMDYFLVTDFGQYHAQGDVRRHLEAHCPVSLRADGVLVFALDGEACVDPGAPFVLREP